MSRIARVMAGLVVLSVALVAPVSADTTGGPTNVDYARGADAAGNYVELYRDNLGGRVQLLLSTTTHEDIACPDGSPGALDIHYYGTGVPTTYAFGRRQSDAAASGYVRGTEETSNTCDGSQSIVTVTHQVAISVVGSRPRTTIRTRRKDVNPDGTTTTVTYLSTEVPASGELVIDAQTSSADGAIGHVEVTNRTR